MPLFEPVYIKTHETGLLHEKITQATAQLKSCSLCPRQCRVDRLSHQEGVCETGRNASVASYGPHFGEEAPLVGEHGSGTIFFTHCSLLCNFCQNFDISHERSGEEVDDTQLASIMLHLQQRGCHNINFVTPSHVVPQILSALEIAIKEGLSVPLIYNSGGYDSVETLKLLNGVFDIYMPDFKFWDTEIAELTCKAPDYPEIARQAVREMFRQVGDLVIAPAGIAQRGLLIRHLVMPDGMAGTPEVMRWIASKISTNTYVNIMLQYRPCGTAYDVPKLAKRPSEKDFELALHTAKEAGITRLDTPEKVFFMFRD